MTECSLGALKLASTREHSVARAKHSMTVAAIAASFSEAEVEDARTRLATIILGLAADRSRDLEEVKTAALGFFIAARSPADVLH